MTDYIVDTDAAAFGKWATLAGIAETRRGVAVVTRVLKNDFINRGRLRAGNHIRPHNIHQLSVKLTGVSHQLTFFCGQANFGASSNHGINSGRGEDRQLASIQKRIFGIAKTDFWKGCDVRKIVEETDIIAKNCLESKISNLVLR